MKTVAIIQSRLRSTRLPAKILLPLPSGRSVLEEVVFRCKEARKVHQACVAIPDTEECDLLLPFTGGACVVRGPELDVLERYRRAAEVTGADIIVRVTSDCPLIPPDMIDRVIDQRNIHGLAYACNNMPRTWPHGYDCEVFTRSALEWHAQESWDAASREHVTTALRRSVEGAMDVNVPCPQGDISDIRWTLDDISDYIRICKVMEGAKGAMDLTKVFT